MSLNLLNAFKAFGFDLTDFSSKVAAPSPVPFVSSLIIFVAEATGINLNIILNGIAITEPTTGIIAITLIIPFKPWF